jgi:hypothetical protein
MKKYQVTLKYTAYAIIDVEEASDEAEAIKLAWIELDSDPEPYKGGGSWEHDCTEEVEE